MGKLKLRFVAFIDLVDLKHPGIANLNFIYPIYNYRLVRYCAQLNVWWK